MGQMIYVVPGEKPLPFEYTTRQILDGIGVLAAAVVGMCTLGVLFLGSIGL